MVILLILLAILAVASGSAAAIRNGRPGLAEARRNAFARTDPRRAPGVDALASLARAGATPSC